MTTNATSNNTPKFAQLSIAEIQKLTQAGATGKTIAVYACIIAHDYHRKCSAYPSIKTLQNLSGLTERAVYRCLRWLRKNGIIEQNHKSSKQRFVLIFRKTVEWGFDKVKKHVKSDSKSQSRHVNNWQQKRQGKRRDYSSNRQPKIDRQRVPEGSGYDKTTKEGITYIIRDNGIQVEENHHMWMRMVQLAADLPGQQKSILGHNQMKAPPERLTMEIVRRHLVEDAQELAKRLLATA